MAYAHEVFLDQVIAEISMLPLYRVALYLGRFRGD